MEKISLSIDKILEFLYGDKRAELLAEVSFVKYANNNYNAIMNSEPQRIATITSLQNAKKIAIKDMEFYLLDLENKVNLNNKTYSEFMEKCQSVDKIIRTLDLAAQLYASSCILEVYYSNNADQTYLDNVFQEAENLLNKCNNCKLSLLSSLRTQNRSFSNKRINTLKLDYISTDAKLNKDFEVLFKSMNSNDNSLVKLVEISFKQINTNVEFYVTPKGEIYTENLE